MKVMFLDESGDHNLNVIDPLYPVFVLGGIIVDLEYAQRAMDKSVKQFKENLFGREDLVLHTADITRNRRGFEKLIESEFRQKFYAELNRLMSTLEYKVVACAIKKENHLIRYGSAALDPYMLSLDVLVERFYYELAGEPDGGVIVAEKRNPNLDRELVSAWETLQVRGTDYVRASKIGQRVQGLHLKDKKDNIAGLQLADLVVSPIGRFVIGKRTQKDFRIVESKFRKDLLGSYLGRGLVVLPRE